MALGKKTGGRVAGTPNKATASIKEYASQHSEASIEALVSIMNDATAPHIARIAAANSVLDRAHGKPTASIEIDATTTQKIDLAAIDAELEKAAQLRAERQAELEARGVIGRFETR